jgi:hypothetical protein
LPSPLHLPLGGDAPLGLFFNEHGHLWFEVHNRSSDEIEINTGPLSQDENGQGEWGSIEVRAEAGTPVVYVWREAPMLGKVPARRNCKVGDFVNGMPLRKSGPGVYRARLTLRVRNTRTGESIFVPSNWHTFRVTPAGRLPGQAHGPYQEFQEAYAYGAACGFGYGSRAEAIQQLLTVAQKYAGTKYALAAYFEAANQADALAHETGEEVYRAKRRELFREIIQRWPDVVSHETIYARLHVQFGTSEAAFLQSRRDAYRWLLSVTQEQKIASLKGYTNLPSGRVADEDVRRALPALNQYIDLMKKMLEQSIPGLDPGDAPSQARQRGVGINS